MANVVVTTDAVNFYVDFGDYGNGNGSVPKNGVYSRRSVMKIEQWVSDKYLHVLLQDGRSEWYISYEDSGQNALIIDTVNGVAPTSLEDLKDKISALML